MRLSGCSSANVIWTLLLEFLRRIPNTHFAFCVAVAKQPLPPQIICDLLGLDQAEVRKAFEAGRPPQASEDQLIFAVKQSIDTEDTVESYLPVIRIHTKRFENQNMVMEALTPKLSAFHKAMGGRSEKIGQLFSDLTPGPQVYKNLPAKSASGGTGWRLSSFCRFPHAMSWQ